jgi:hypothetical protein
VAVSIDARLNGIMNEVELANHYLHHATDDNLEERIVASLQMAGEHEQEIGDTIRRHLAIYKNKTEAMSQYFTKWLKEQF